MAIAVWVYFLILYFIIFISGSEFDFCANASFLLHGSLVWNPYTEIHRSMFFWFKSVLVTCRLSTLSVLVYKYSSVKISSEILYELHSIWEYIVGNITSFRILMLRVYEHFFILSVFFNLFLQFLKISLYMFFPSLVHCTFKDFFLESYYESFFSNLSIFIILAYRKVSVAIFGWL